MTDSQPNIVQNNVSNKPSLDFLPTLLTHLQTSLHYEFDFENVPDVVTTAVEEAAVSSGIDYKNSTYYRVCFDTAVAKMYPYHPLDIKVHIAIYSWISFIIDDKTGSMLEGVEVFQQRFFSNIPQHTPLLELFAQTLKQTDKYYDPIIARFIVLSSLAFLNICLLEARKEYQNMPPMKGGEKWAYYFREKEGICEAYAYFCFPKARCPDISVFLQAIPDMCILINQVNDLFSFYKEILAGDVNNYIHKRAGYEKKSIADVMQEMSDETISCYDGVCLVLKGKDAYEEAWLGYVNGYITMHKATPRYKLGEIGLGL